MGEDKECCCVKKHEDHVCMLKIKGKIRKIKDLTGTPNVACYICGAEANSKDNVCSPVPLFI